mgnify:CR=1 FL=1
MLKDLLKACRSYRGYDESYRFTEEELMELVDHTRYAASSMNIQPLKFYLAWEKEEVDRIQPLTGWAKQMPEMELPHKGMCPTAFIIICQDLSVDDRLARFHRDVGIGGADDPSCGSREGTWRMHDRKLRGKAG